MVHRVESLVLLACAVAVLCGLSAGCGEQSPGPVSADLAQDGTETADLGAEVPADLPPAADSASNEAGAVGESRGELFDEATAVECDPGEGCFLDKCSGNGDCQSGWCVEHLGEGVCSRLCTEECPPGWACKQVAGTDPDLIFVCVSQYANLCRPCKDAAGCQGVAGEEDVCLGYGAEGSFCGGACGADKECPWGFACGEATTVDGIVVKQCVAAAGVCPCTAKSAALALWTPCETANEFGSCEGKRVCTESGLSACDAPEALLETCNGADDDCDGDVDEPLEQGGDYLNLCDDANECTTDSCLGLDGCLHEDLDFGECKDGDACTAGDHCEEGLCVGLAIACDDGNPCTDDSCDGLGGCTAQHNAAACDDGDPCTVGDGCKEGECAGFKVDCDCKTKADCAQLEDGNVCNGSLLCDTTKLPYSCAIDPSTVVSCPLPEGPEAFCQEAACDPASGECSFEPAHEGFACDDGDPCTVGEKCLAGLCAAGVAVNCNDGNVCTDDSCQAKAGCVHLPNLGACSDLNACTVGEKCTAGFCQGGTSIDCDDGNPCTMDTCEPGAGCQHKETVGPCDDGNVCTLNETCLAGKCTHQALLACSDSEVCTTDTCDPKSGCLFTMNTAPCDDGKLCTINDHCQVGVCIGGGSLECKDGNPCTTDSCSDKAGCQFVPQEGACDDKNACTLQDKCVGGACLGTAGLDCDDGNPCTEDLCDLALGCINEPNSAPCSDGDVCTVEDACAAGKCAPGKPLVCKDGNQCTDDACVPAIGCAFTPNLGFCNDGNACTSGDTCVNGNCLPGAAVKCNDSLYCNGEEACHPAKGCVTGPPPALDDGLSCTLDACDEDKDAVVHLPDDAKCNNGKWCDGTEKCDSVIGCVAGPPPSLDDGIACTADSCDEASDKVLHTPDDQKCADADKCTLDTCVPAVGCKHEFSGVACGSFDIANKKIHLANGIFIKCFGGLTVTEAQVSCKFALFNTESYSLDASKNVMLGLHNSGETYAAGHTYIQQQIGVAVGYAGNRTVEMNEGGMDNMWANTGSHDNEHCYHQGQLLNWKQNAVCNGGLTGGNNVLSSFVLYK